MPYRNELNGLRALAVLAVLFFHAGFSPFQGGFVGVDVFFVLSGFLLARIGLDQIRRGNFSISGFYLRRIRRIIPALFVVQLSCIPFVLVYYSPGDVDEFGRSLMAVSGFVANFFFWLETDYFSTAAQYKPLLHAWSIGVEEQFYLLFPWTVGVLARWPGQRLWFLGGALVLGSLGLAQALMGSYPGTAFYLLPTRIWEFVLGVGAGVWDFRKSVRASQSLSVLGLGAIVFSVCFFEKHWVPGIPTLLPTLGTTMVLLFARHGTLVHRVLSLPPLVAVGLVSYSIYLWHYPVFAFARYLTLGEISAVHRLFLCLLTVGVSALSWRWVEQPVRQLRGASGRKLVAGGMGALALVAVLGLAVQHDGWRTSHNVRRYIFSTAYDPRNLFLKRQSWKRVKQRANKIPFYPSDQRYNLLVLGDSHAKDVYNVLLHAPGVTRRFELRRIGVAGCLKSGGVCPALMSEKFDSADAYFLNTRYDPDKIQHLEKLLLYLLGTGKPVVATRKLVEFPQTGRWSLADVLFQRLLKKKSENQLGEADLGYINRQHYIEYQERRNGRSYQLIDALFESVKTRYPHHFVVLDRMDYICHHSRRMCFGMGPNFEKNFYDYGHHTLAGARFFGARVDAMNWLRPLLIPLQAPRRYQDLSSVSDQ